MHTASRRLISVVVPTRDRPDYLRQALASIRALETADVGFEILIGDNGSDPRTAAVSAEFGARHLPVSKPGAGAARNAGLAAAQGEFIAFLDDDDLWMDTHIRPHLELFDADPSLEAVMAQVIPVNDEMRALDDPWPFRAPREGDDLIHSMLSGYYPQIGATIVRAHVRDEVGLFDESLLGDQDWDWQLRLARRRRTVHTPAPCVYFRQRPAGSYDALRLRRLGFGRRVFFRHALPERRVFGSWRGLMNSYRDVMWQYYDYFVEAATGRAEQGAPRKDVWRAIWGAVRTFPLRGAYHLIAPKPLRKALVSSFTRGAHPRPPALRAH